MSLTYPDTRSLRILAWRAGIAPQTLPLRSVLCSEPLELEYLDTVLIGHELVMIDGLADGSDPVLAAGALRAEIVLISCCITNLDLSLGVARRLKELPSAPLVFLGGPHLEVVPEHGMNPAVDGVFFADALNGVRALVDRLALGKGQAGIPGMLSREGDVWTKTPGPPMDPSRLPIPRRRLLMATPSRYNYMYHRPCASVKTAYGCPGRCSFCFCAEMQQGRYMPRPLEAVIEELGTIPFKSIFLLDDDFFVEPARVLRFSELLAAKGISKRFIAYGAVRNVLRAREALIAFKGQGLDALILGLESVEDEDLRDWRKGATARDNDAALELCRALDIQVFALFLVDPDWTHSDFFRLARFLVRREIAFATFSTLQALPGTELARGAHGEPSSVPVLRDSWMFDLLRLHGPPGHLSRVGFYLWMFLLYLLPTFRFSTLLVLWRRYGLFGWLGLVLRVSSMGIRFFFRLLRWH